MRLLSGCVAVLGLVIVCISQQIPAVAAPVLAAPELSFYAASSLREVLAELAPQCESATGTRLVFNFGASNDLARQIEAAGKADIFFSADEAWMDRIQKGGFVDSGSRRTLLSNRLVVIGRTDSALDINSRGDLRDPAIRRIALANPEAVPAGKYAKQWLVKTGQWEWIRQRLLPAIDVRAAMAAVTSSGADAAVVYLTDARLSTKVRVLYEVPQDDGPKISYPVAVMRDRPFMTESRQVVSCLSGPHAAAVFERFGFIVIAGPSGTGR